MTNLWNLKQSNIEPFLFQKFHLKLHFCRVIIQSLPKIKQIIAFSATYPPFVLEELNSFMNNPTKILLNVENPSLQGVKQYFFQVDSNSYKKNYHFEKLIELLSKISFYQCIIFCNSRTRFIFPFFKSE